MTWALKDKKEWRTGKEESPGAGGRDVGSPDGHEGGCGGERGDGAGVHSGLGEAAVASKGDSARRAGRV